MRRNSSKESVFYFIFIYPSKAILMDVVPLLEEQSMNEVWDKYYSSREAKSESIKCEIVCNEKRKFSSRNHEILYHFLICLYISSLKIKR